MPLIKEITPLQARKLALAGQYLSGTSLGRGLKGTRQAIQALGYIQIDTISVIERAHHHTLWNRVPHYKHRFLDKLVEQRDIFEYWSHAAAWLPMEDYRFCLPRMKAIRSGQRHWYKTDQKTLRYVLERITSDGPLQARDFEEHTGFNAGMWEWGPIKQAIEQLFMQGDVLVTRRDRFQKVFDLAERIIPAHVDTREPSRNEFAHFLIDRHLKAHGIARPTEFGYLRKGMGPAIKQAVAEQLEEGKLLKAKFRKRPHHYLVPANYDSLLAQRSPRSRVRILSPFDNLVIQRERIRWLFDFDYQIECYVPADKRKDGYFVCPVLWQGTLVARMDAKADRQNARFIVRNLVTESKLKNVDGFTLAFGRELMKFASFNQCPNLEFDSDLCKLNPELMNLVRTNLGYA